MSGGVVVLVVCLACICCCVAVLWIPLTGWAPKRVKQSWTKLMRMTKCGDKYEWSWSKVADQLYIGTLPRFKEDLIELRDKEGVFSVVTMNEEWEIELGKSDVEALGMANLIMATPDYSAPPLADVQAAVAWALEATDRGEGVYVHCNAGRGRSAIVVLCILMSRFGWDALEAYDHVSSKRRVVKLPSLCETKPQWRVVREYERWLESQHTAGQVVIEANKLPGLTEQEGVALSASVPAEQTSRGEKADECVPAVLHIPPQQAGPERVSPRTSERESLITPSPEPHLDDVDDFINGCIDVFPESNNMQTDNGADGEKVSLEVRQHVGANEDAEVEEEAITLVEHSESTKNVNES